MNCKLSISFLKYVIQNCLNVFAQASLLPQYNKKKCVVKCENSRAVDVAQPGIRQTENIIYRTLEKCTFFYFKGENVKSADV